MNTYHKDLLTIPIDLFLAQKFAYEPCGLLHKNLLQDVESRDYSACTFQINSKIVKFRIAKITPIKTGQFVTIWKRIAGGPIVPYDFVDEFDFFIVSIRNGESCGQFIFPKQVLLGKGFISNKGWGGKRAMRVYPPWDIAKNNQAKKTQSWQLPYYVEIQPNPDYDTIKKLFY